MATTTTSKSWADIQEESEDIEKATEAQKELCEKIDKLPQIVKDTSAASSSESVASEAPSSTSEPRQKSSQLYDEEDSQVIVTHSDTGATSDSHLGSAASFDVFGLNEKILAGVYHKKFSKPSKIQESTLPHILKGANVIAQARSGTGKTAAFLLGMLSLCDFSLNQPQAMCVGPTRELVRQIYEVAKELAKFTDAKIQLIVPDEKYPIPITSHIIIGTPGTLDTVIKKKQLDIRHVKMFVLDEADHMLDQQNLGVQTLRLQKKCPKNTQMLCFSATYAAEVRKFAEQVVPHPFVGIALPVKDLNVKKIKQLYIEVSNERDRFSVLSDIYAYMNIGQTIIFVNTKVTANELGRNMIKDQHTVSVLHGDLESKDRDKVIDDYREGRTKVLIATNVISRGIDIPQVSMVINYDLPVHTTGKADTENYLHRIGRSGRFGRSGVAVNFVYNHHTRNVLRFLEQYYGIEIAEVKAADIPMLEEILKKITDELSS